MAESTLRRSIGLGLLTFYGLGTILGAGIYVLIGEVAKNAGMAAPSSFAIASMLAAFTALSFAELSARLPKSAGEAAYVDAAFRWPAFSTLVGWAVVLVGIVSAATMVRGFVGYLGVFIELPSSLVIVAAVAGLGALAAWGINESLIAAAAITLLEIFGLFFVCFIARDSLTAFPAEWSSLLPRTNGTSLVGVLSGAFVAFYAFIGFEDMVNVAEEVEDPRRNLPRAILLALIVSTVLYFLVATVAVLSVPITSLGESEAPLALIVESRGMPPEIIAGISLLAVLNGALVQIIMATRVLYGLSSSGLAWRALGRIDSRTQTPLIGTLVVASALLVLAMYFSLGGLARATSFIALAIFIIVNASLWRIKRIQGNTPSFAIPAVIPIAGVVLCTAMFAFEAWRLIDSWD